MNIVTHKKKEAVFTGQHRSEESLHHSRSDLNQIQDDLHEEILAILPMAAPLLY